ncbi:hypothetical protein VTJ83DRAFT_945 [Remersonia thermophila]|uniref:SAM-dependent MTase RsmB/NOP-type domain-containing protein n=1 Tax=Remersonia thermophila TaxID=72144 RepID=A0ABR4DQ65_9PEZI
MSLYHETAAVLAAPSSHGGSLKSRIFSDKSLKSSPAQVYALAFESSKWSVILKEVVENSELLQTEKRLTPALSILLVHDLLLSKKGIALPASHGLRLAVEKHKARLQAELTRARVRRKCATVDDLRALVDAELGPAHPRWIRINALKTTLDDQLDTTFRGFVVVPSIDEVVASAGQGRRVICLDGHVPNLIAASPGVDFTKTEAYKSGAIILQDKASCFPAYLLDPRPEDGDVIDACSAPGNKTTHLAAILHERRASGAGGSGGAVAWAPRQGAQPAPRVLAFEKDAQRAEVLKKMVHKAGAGDVTTVHGGADFLQTNPDAPEFRRVGALLLDPSCSGSGIVGRDDAPVFHLPSAGSGKGGNGNNNGTAKKKTTTMAATTTNLGKRKRPGHGSGITSQEQQQQKQQQKAPAPSAPPDSTSDPARLASLSAFQLTLVQHAFRFPAARKITYSTCSVHAEENEKVVLAALASEAARARGWRVQRRDEQVRGMREWPVRGDREACGEGHLEVAEACIRAQRGDGRGTMGFFVACFVRDGKEDEGDEEGGEVARGDRKRGKKEEDDGPFVRDESGRIVRDEDGIPILKSTGKKVLEMKDLEKQGVVEVRFGGEDDDDDDGPFERDAQGRIIRGPDGMPRLKPRRGPKEMVVADDEEEDGEEEDDGEEWGGFDD